MTGVETIELRPNVAGVVDWVAAGMFESDRDTARRVMLAATGSTVPRRVSAAIAGALCRGLSDRADVIAWRDFPGPGLSTGREGVALVYRSGGPGGGPRLPFSTHRVLLPAVGDRVGVVSGVYDLPLGDAFADWCDRAGVIL